VDGNVIMSVGLPGRGRLPYHTDPESEVSL